MTREQKLALIIGFSLVMVVGVLISDHFSRARTDALGSAVDQRNGGGGSRIDPISLVADEPPLDEAWVRDPLPSRTPPAPDPAPTQAVTQPEPAVAIVMGAPPVVDPMAAAPAQTSGAEAARTVLAGPPLTQPTPAAAMNTDVAAEMSVPTTVPVADPLSEMFEPVYATREVPSRSQPDPAPTVAAERTHTVAEGESLWKIAERHYGDGSKWTRIRDRNPKLVDDEGIVQAGVTLAIPLDAAAAAAKPAGSKPATLPAQPKTDEKKASPPAKQRTYIVRKGDSLGEIAKRELGSARRWPEIVKLNDIEDPDHVPAGVTLRLPS